MAPYLAISERFFLASVLITVLTLPGLVLTGCGRRAESMGEVHGKVTFQGKAVREGLIKFQNPEKGIYMNARIGPDGSYAVQMAQGAGLPLETYNVSIGPPPVQVGLGPAVGPPPTPHAGSDIPAKYRRCETSGLTVTVKQGENPFNVDMKP